MYYDRAIIRNRHKPGKYAQTRDKLMLSTPYELAPILAWELAEHVMKPWLRPRAFLERFSTHFCEALRC